MIRMDMRINDVTHGSIGHLTDCTIECSPFREATACIDYRNTAIADDEPNIRELVALKYDRSMPGPHVNTCCDLDDIA
jgi:hypothetical protein